MSEFDEWWEENYMLVSADRTEAEDIYNLGAQSRQAEIDELQKRIKKAEKLMRLFFKEDSYEYAISAHDILKGNKND